MKHLVATAIIVAATASPALAETTQATVRDHFKTVIEQQPYRVEVCKDVQVPQKNEMNTEGAIIGGIIGGVIGAAASKQLSARKGLLNSVFAVLIFCVALYMLWKSWSAM